MASRDANWSDSGSYKATFDLNAKIKNGISKSDFKFYYTESLKPVVAREVLEDENSSISTLDIKPVYINDFNLSITNDKTLQLSFVNPINKDINSTVYKTFILQTDKNVTTDNKQLLAYFSIQPINYTFSKVESSGFNSAVAKRSIKLTLHDGQKFAPVLDKSMFTLDLANIITTATRQSDKEVLLNFDSMPETLEANTIPLYISQDAFEYNFFGNKTLFIESSKPSAWLNQKEVKFNNNQLTLKIYYSSNYSGIENGVSIDGMDIKSQSFKDNSYTIILNSENSLTDYMNKLKDLSADVKLSTKNGKEVETNKVALTLIRPYIVANIVTKPSEKHKIEIDIKPVLSEFDKSIDLSDFTIVEKKSTELTNLKTINKGTKNIRLSFDTLDKIVILDIKLNDKSKLIAQGDLKPKLPIKTQISISAYDIEEYKGVGGEIAKSFGLGIVSGVGSFFATTALNYAMPYIYEGLGLEPDASLSSLDTKMDEIGSKLENISGSITVVKDENLRNFVSNFNSDYTQIHELNMNIMDTKSFIEFSKAFSKNSSASEAEKQVAIDKFDNDIKSIIVNDDAYIRYATIVKDFGRKLLYRTSSTADDGAYRVFFDLQDDVYNFITQTYNGKINFWSKNTTEYFMAASFLYDYAIRNNKTNSAENLKAQMELVLAQANKYKTKIDNIEKLINTKRDILLFTNKNISKYMGYTKIKWYKYADFTHEITRSHNIYNLSLDTYEQMNRRAKARGKNLVDDMNNAGFIGLKKYNNKYYFSTGSYPAMNKVLLGATSSGLGFTTLFTIGMSSSPIIGKFYLDLYVMDGTNGFKEKHKEVTRQKYWIKWWKKHFSTTEYIGNIINFTY